MRPVTVCCQGMTAEISGGWIQACPDDPSRPDRLRMDDGDVSPCPDRGMKPGDRIYRILYHGPSLVGMMGAEIHDVTTGMVHTSCRTVVRSPSRLYVAIAAIPGLLLLVVAMLALVAGMSLPPALVATLLCATLMPMIAWLAQGASDGTRNRRDAAAMSACRNLCMAAVDQDVAVWKERLVDVLPGLDPGTTTVIRGTSCRLVEGAASVDGATPQIVRPGRPISIPPAAVALCALEDGDLVHAIIPSGRIPAIPLAVSNPLSGITWTDDAIAGGRDGLPYRNAMKAALGRAAWRMVSREWDELGRRRKNARRA